MKKTNKIIMMAMMLAGLFVGSAVYGDCCECIDGKNIMKGKSGVCKYAYVSKTNCQYKSSAGKTTEKSTINLLVTDKGVATPVGPTGPVCYLSDNSDPSKPPVNCCTDASAVCANLGTNVVCSNCGHAASSHNCNASSGSDTTCAYPSQEGGSCQATKLPGTCSN